MEDHALGSSSVYPKFFRKKVLAATAGQKVSILNAQRESLSQSRVNTWSIGTRACSMCVCVEIKDFAGLSLL